MRCTTLQIPLKPKSKPSTYRGTEIASGICGSLQEVGEAAAKTLLLLAPLHVVPNIQAPKGLLYRGSIDKTIAMSIISLLSAAVIVGWGLPSEAPRTFVTRLSFRRSPQVPTRPAIAVNTPQIRPRESPQEAPQIGPQIGPQSQKDLQAGSPRRGKSIEAPYQAYQAKYIPGL